MKSIISDLLKEGHAAQQKGNYDIALKRYQEVLSIDPYHVTTLNNMSIIFINQSRLADAEAVLMKIMEKTEDADAFNHLGVVYMRSGRLEAAEKLLQHALLLSPFKFEIFLNLGNIYSLLDQNDKALHYALEAVKSNNTSSSAFNNLGTVLSNMAMFDEAEIAFQTAVDLDKNNLEAFVNLGSRQSQTKRPLDAIKTYEKAVRRLPKHASTQAHVIKFLLAFEYLKIGNLEDGWVCYDSGFHPNIPSTNARTPARTFDVPLWNGKKIPNKTLLIWREQGLGDELLFLTCLPDLLKFHDNVIIEVEYRLVSIVRRTFPNVIVREQNYGSAPNYAAIFKDYDFHLPMGSLMRYFRKSIKSFPKSMNLTVDADRAVEYENRLGPKNGKFRIGLCWRSGRINELRALHYINILKLAPLFAVENIQWVNLQYGECEAECLAAENEFGIKIERWDDLDLKNDLDGVFSLISTLDLVITAATTVSSMAPLVGVQTLMFQKDYDWTTFGQDKDPWFDCLHRLRAQSDNIEDVIPALTDKLNSVLQSQKNDK